MSEERVQKALSRLGFGSRREIEGWIQQGRVKVNGKVVELGSKVSAGDSVHCNGRTVEIKVTERHVRVLAYNKPEGEVSTRKDEAGRATVFDRLPGIPNGRWVSIGRLDINTSGLLLFTNDGELANRLMHPSNEIEREYAVRVNGVVDDAKLGRLRKGVRLDDGMAKFDVIEYAEPDDATGSANHWYHVIVKEGRNREVRRLWEAVDTRVSRLIRVRYDEFVMPRDLRKGKTFELDFELVEHLCAKVGLKCEAPKPGRLRGKARKQHYTTGGRRSPGVKKRASPQRRKHKK